VDKEEPKIAEEKTPIDYKKLTAEELLPLAEKGETEVQFFLGQMYRRGKGVPQDYQLAAKWYKRSAEQGHAGAQNNLGVMYAKGNSVPQDYQEAVKWYKKAAEQGNTKAQFSLGVMYALGQGVPQDYVLAHKWYNLAAAQGHEDGKHNRDVVAKKMTPSQISEAQKLAREFKPKKEKP